VGHAGAGDALSPISPAIAIQVSARDAVHNPLPTFTDNALWNRGHSCGDAPASNPRVRDQS
jgi:hypothetical protein